jgi:hypothetical protein
LATRIWPVEPLGWSTASQYVEPAVIVSPVVGRQEFHDAATGELIVQDISHAPAEPDVPP